LQAGDVGSTPIGSTNILEIIMSVYIELLHGRKSPKEELNGWGSQGPVFGPYDWAHMTYASHIRMGAEEGFIEDELFISKDHLIHYNGIWYGDVTIMSCKEYRSQKELKKRLEKFSDEKAINSKIEGWNIQRNKKTTVGAK
jgi:hypothetical protein